MIQTTSVSKDFGAFTALDDVSLHVPEGSLTALLGPSGSGKSTLLRIIAGLEQPDRGQVLVDGVDQTTVPARKRDIGFVFQHYAAFKHMSVFENVAFGLRIRKRPKPEIKARVDELLELVGLAAWAKHRPAQLSGGQRQRMALARALAVQPRVLLLDEPFGALDANVRADLRAWLRRLHEQVPVTTVLVTHDQEEAMEVADRLAVLRDGRIEQVGSPREVYEAPANAFVMGFIGPVSRLGGELVRPHDVVLVDEPGDGRAGGAGRARRPPRLRGPHRAHAARRRGAAGAGDARGGRRARALLRRHRVGQGASGADPARQRVTQDSGSSASRWTSSFSVLPARSASVTCSTTLRRLVRTAIHTRCSSAAAAGVVDVLGALAADAGQRALDGADDVGERHVVRLLGQPVAALGAALAADDARLPQVGEDVLEELLRDVLRRRELRALDGAAAGGGELGRRADGVVDLGGDAHAGRLSGSELPHAAACGGVRDELAQATLAGVLALGARHPVGHDAAVAGRLGVEERARRGIGVQEGCLLGGELLRLVLLERVDPAARRRCAGRTQRGPRAASGPRARGARRWRC